MTSPAPPLDGALVVDKPVGPTSHDVVARVRRALGTRRVGHTGTLDPLASGVLPVVVGAATRLARFLSAGVKAYDAVVRLGSATDSGDLAGAVIEAPPDGDAPVPDLEAAAQALARFVGPFDQVPPAFSAKKVGGVRAYVLAREQRAVDLRGVRVSLHAAEALGLEGVELRIRLVCSAGFYVRALARDLGEALGCGGHLVALRRTASGPFTTAMAVPLDAIEQSPDAARARLVQPVDLLPWAALVCLTPAGVERVRHGHRVGPEEIAGIERGLLDAPRPPAWPALVRLVGPTGALIAVATRGIDPDGSLHPDIVLV